MEALEFNSALRRVFFFHDEIGEERAEALEPSGAHSAGILLLPVPRRLVH